MSQSSRLKYTCVLAYNNSLLNHKFEKVGLIKLICSNSNSIINKVFIRT